MSDMAMVDLAQFDAAVFDLDGTLVDSEPAWERAKLTIAERRGVSITRAQLDASVGRSMDELVATVFAPADAAAARAIELEVFAEGEKWLGDLRKPIPGAADFLRDMHGRGLRIALCSSAPEYLIRDALVQLQVLDLVELIVSADPLPRRKPDPYPYQVTAEGLGLSPDRLIGFEDALPGALSSKGAGLFTAAIGPEALKPEFAFCDLQAQDYPDLRRKLGM